MGAGAIGCRTAQLCRAFGCRVLGYKRHLTGQEPDCIEFVPLNQLLEQSDIVSLHCPLNDESRHLIDKDAIARDEGTGPTSSTPRAGRWSIRRRWPTP